MDDLTHILVEAGNNKMHRMLYCFRFHRHFNLAHEIICHFVTAKSEPAVYQLWFAIASLCHGSRTRKRPFHSNQGGIGLAAGSSMPFGAEEYGGYTIHWDTSASPDATLWRARAGVVSPDRSGLPTIHSITADRFKSEGGSSGLCPTGGAGVG